MPLDDESGKSGLAGQGLRGGKAGLNACRFGKGVGNEIAYYIAGAHLHEKTDAVVIPEGLHIILPMDGGFQVGHEDAPDLNGV
jgi:hypothetical protein